MKDEQIKKFFRDNTQNIEDKGFTERLMNHIDCLPAPEHPVKKSSLPVIIFSLAGFVLFVALGGYSVLIKALAGMGSLFKEGGTFIPEVIIPVFFLLCFMFAGVRYLIQKM